VITILQFIADVARAIGIPPIVLLGILLFFLAGLHQWATSYLARRDIEAAIRNAQKRGKHQPPTP
jgi:hypothetical protein